MRRGRSPATPTTSSRRNWPPTARSCCARCARPASTTRTSCASRATAVRTTCWSPSWRPAGPLTRCCPRRERTPPGGSVARRVWIVDPLDGTREFGEPDRPDWAVHVALVIDGFPVAGAVALPALNEVWSTAAAPSGERPPSRTAKHRPAKHRPGKHWLGKHRPAAAGGEPDPSRLGRLAWSSRRCAAELVPLGSAGFKALAVVRGVAEIYAHSGGQYEWDSARPGGRGPGPRPARLAARRHPARLQQPRPLPARPADRAPRLGAVGPGREVPPC